MSNRTFYSEFLYNLPAAAFHEFTRVMDSLPDSDWLRFASRVICDQTELRLVEQSGRRTATLMNKWENRNATIGNLVTLLEDLQLLRPRDIILRLGHISQPSPVSSFLPSPSLTCRSSPSPSLFTASKDVTRSLPILESKLLPKPGPPPPDLTRLCPCPASTVSNGRKKEEHPCGSCDAQSPWVTPGVMCWPFHEVQQGTDNFSAARQIGEGGFGHVYRATMRNTDFAVKRLKEDSHLGWSVVKESFRTEVERLSQYRHPNIVDLCGYSVEGETYCLIYAYMPSGSLEDRLCCEKVSALSWSQRVKVVLGSAKALQYLHSCSPALIHGDVKSSNILLGEHLEPKLGDFGLARLCRNPSRTPGKTSSVAQTSTVRGTLAYLPDEYLKDGHLGMEIDVYSFGVVLLEVLTGRKALETSSHSKNVYLKDLVSELEDDGRSYSRRKDTTRELSNSQAAENIWKKHLDPWLMSKGTSGPDGSKEVAQLACRCLDRRRKKRPPMTEVCDTLLDVHKGLEALSGTVTDRLSSPPSPPLHQYLSSPKPLCSVDSLSHQFSRLGPQENTFCCSHNNHSFPRPPSPVTCSELPESGRREGPSDSRYSSFRAPCESDESQGYSQYYSPPCTAQRNAMAPQPWPEGNAHIRASQSDSFSIVTPMPLSVTSDDRVIINPVRRRLVEKMALYEEGRILSSDLFSSGGSSNGELPRQPREPEESDEFASSLA
ncbi:interleukin-1 receptor-associated kinase 1 [Clarias gariepinus]